MYSSPSIADEVVYIGSLDHHLYAVDANTGHEKWRFETEGAVVSTAAIADGVVYFVSEAGLLYAVQ